MRREYVAPSLRKRHLPDNPFQAFKLWFDAFLETKPLDANAVSLATASASGVPSLRTVLIKEIDDKGFSFFTNFNSEKGKQLQENPIASLLFYWPSLHRQIRIDGHVVKLSQQESESYFHSRPQDSQIMAYVSKQSHQIQSKSMLEQAFLEAKQEFQEKVVPLPDQWGGFKLIAEYFEFWQGQPNRMHDRVFYKKQSNSHWEKGRLAP